MESLVPSTECREAGVHQALKALSCDKPVRDKLGHIKGVKNEVIESTPTYVIKRISQQRSSIQRIRA